MAKQVVPGNNSLVVNPDGSTSLVPSVGTTSWTLATHAHVSAATGGSISGSGDISGTGVAGQVAEFVTDTKTLQAAKLIGPAVNILTLTNSAAATLALAITAAKTLTLTSTDTYTLTVAGAASIIGTNTGDVANTALTTGKLSQFAATTSAELAGVISDETGTDKLVYNTSPTLLTSIETTSTTFTALAGATTLLTIGGTGATAVFAIPGTLEATGTTGALTVAGGVYIAKHLTVEGVTSTGATGTGKIVFDGTPTIVTPTIASFVNANHSHITAAGGGLIAEQRILPTNQALADGQSLVLNRYLNLVTFSVTLAGDSAIRLL